MMQFTAIVSFILIMSASNDVLAQWQVQQVPHNRNLRSVHFVNSGVGFAVGATYTSIKTTDGGQSWVHMSLAGEYKSIYFPSDAVGFAVDRGIMKTTNGGNTWRAVYSHPEKDAGHSYNGVFFINDNRGIVVGSSDSSESVILTSDAGGKWYNLNLNVHLFKNYLNSISVVFANEFIGYVLSWNYQKYLLASELFITKDGGDTWVRNESWWQFAGSYLLIPKTAAIQGTTRVWVVGSKSYPVNFPRNPYKNSRVFFTSDGGESWDTTKFVFPYTVNSIVFANELVGFIGDTLGNIYSTIDGGATWKNDNAPSNGRSINSIAIAGGTAVYAVGDGGLILKRDIPTSVMAENSALGMEVFPNPSTGRVRIRINAEAANASVRITDVLGREVFAASLQQNDIEIDLGRLQHGMYAVQVRIGGNVKSNLLVLGRE